MFGGEGGILFCFFTFIAIAIILNLAICQVNLNSTKVIGKTVQQRIEQQQTSSARPRGSDQGSLGVFTCLQGLLSPSVQLGLAGGPESH